MSVPLLGVDIPIRWYLDRNKPEPTAAIAKDRLREVLAFDRVSFGTARGNDFAIYAISHLRPTSFLPRFSGNG